MKTKNKKTLIVLIGLLMAIATTITYGQELKIVVKNVKGEEGMVRLALYNSDDQFMKKEIKGVEVKSKGGEAVAVFQNVAPGTYAISVMHDANDNKELDSNFMGIPKEGFGFSNDAMGMFGPPDFKKASFDVAGEKEVVINLRYM
jgi:uncharacterized protein (DUF2141 family)